MVDEDGQVTTERENADDERRSMDAATYEYDELLCEVCGVEAALLAPFADDVFDTVNGDLYDVNNPDAVVKRGRRPSAAMLFELEFGKHQQRQLHQAREQASRWKDPSESVSGCIRAATLHAHYAAERKCWWFEVHLSVGFKPTHIEEPQHVISVHIDPITGWYATVLKLDGTLVAQQQLDEHTIAQLLKNKQPEQ